MPVLNKRKGVRVYSFLFLLLFMLYPDIYLSGPSGGEMFSWFGEDGDSGQSGESADQGDEQTEEEREAQMMGQLIRLENIWQSYPLMDAVPEGEEPDGYIMLLSPGDTVYQVKAGDTLWGISREFYRTGTAWQVLAEQYPGLADGSETLLPGMELSVPRIQYVRKQEDSKGGFSSPACTYDFPSDWHFGYPEWEPCLTSYWSQCQDATVYVHITESEPLGFPFPGYDREQYQETVEQIQNCMKETTADRPGIEFGELEFDSYLRQDGTELFFYTFLAETEEIRVRYGVAYVDGGTYTAEVIGFCPLPENENDEGLICPIEEITRYIAASYTEFDEEKNFSSLKYRPYTGHETWDWEKLHNPFAMAAVYYRAEENAVLTGEDYDIAFESEEWEDLLRKMVRYHFDLSKEEQEELENRPLRASDLAWITEVSLTEHPVPGRDDVDVNGLEPGGEYDLADYNLTTARDLAVLPNLRSLTLEIGTISDYEALVDCAGLEELTIVSAEPLKDATWLSKLPALKSLTLEISMFTHLHTLGFTDDDPTTFSSETMPDTDYYEQTSYDQAFFDALGECGGLEYLSIRHRGAFDSSFLEKLPGLYCFRLSGEDDDTEAKAKRLEDFETFPERYQHLHCLVIDGNWLRNEE